MGRVWDATANRRGSRWAIAVLCAALIAGCGGGGSGGGGPPPAADGAPPSVPLGVTASAVSTTQIVVSWQASSDSGTGVAGYRVFRNGGSTAIATVTNPSFTDSGLAPATQYSYSVRAFDAATPANESALSSAAATTTKATTVDAGLDGRPDNSTCVAGDRPAQAVTLATERAFPNLPAFSSPILMLQAPGDATRWFVVELGGTVRAFDNQATVATSRMFVDITARVRSGGEQGLLGVAFHPGYPADPRVYLSYTNATNGLVSRISEFRTRDGGLTLDPASEVILLTVAQPAANHNGGNIAFGPDGFLYVGFGDGGSGGDPWGSIGNGQNLTTTLGKLLRIDVQGSTGNVPYRIPAGQSVRRQCAVQWRCRHAELSGDLCLRTAQSMALELRPRHGRVVARRRGARRDRGSESHRARRQLRLALLRRDPNLQRRLRAERAEQPAARRAV